MKDKNDIVIVSVFMTTYNHERYVKQAVESVLAQKTNFKFELLVGDDASTDKTQEILRKYFSNIENVRLILRKENAKGRNGYLLRKKARGKYIFACDGDDYLLGDDVLQTFVDFMEAHPNCAGVSGRRYILSERNRSRRINIEKNRCNKYISLDDLLNGVFFDYCATLYRNMFHDGVYDYRTYRYSRKVGDLTMSILILLHGDVYITDKIVGVYRTDRIESASSYNNTTTSLQKYKDHMNLIETLEKELPVKMNYLNLKILYSNHYLGTQNGVLTRILCIPNIIGRIGLKLFFCNIKAFDIFR